MNSVSWFVYLAGVFENLSGVIFAAIFVLVPVVGVSTALGTFMRSDGGYTDNKERKRETIAFFEAQRQRFAYIAKLAWPALIVCVLLAIVVPSKNTMYAIAASQVGERVVKSEAIQGMADDATKALQQWIKRQLEPTRKKD